MKIVDLLKKIFAVLTGKKAQDMVMTGVALINLAEPIVKVFASASGNVTLQSLTAGYEKYGLPVSQAMQDGKLTSDELKALAGLGVQTVLEKTKGCTGTAAALANVLAFCQQKYGA